MRRPGWKGIGKALLFSLAGLAAAVVAGSVATGWLLVRPARKKDYDCIPRVRHGRLAPQTLRTADGLSLHAWLQLSMMAGANDWVLVLHGYRSDRTVLQTRARFFARRGFNVLMLHFRGHGSSDPDLISYGYREKFDVKAAFDYIRSFHPGVDTRVGINGISMGAAAAAYAVADELVDPAWMILESCYDNISNALANRVAMRFGESLTPWIAWPVETVVEYLTAVRSKDLDPAKALEKARCPIMVMAGDSEQVLKMVEIEYLYGCIPEPKRLEVFPGVGHQDLLLCDPRRYIRAVDGFLSDFSGKRPVERNPLRPKTESTGLMTGAG